MRKLVFITNPPFHIAEEIIRKACKKWYNNNVAEIKFYGFTE